MKARRSVRAAQANLESHGKPAGFTADPAKYVETIDGPSAVSTNDDTFQLSVMVPQDRPGIDQVEAVLAAMKAHDNSLNDAKQTAIKSAQDAHAAVVLQTKALENLRKNRLDESGKVENAPRRIAVQSQEKLASDAEQALGEARNAVQVNQSLMDEIRSQDPSRPADPDSDPTVIALRKDIQRRQVQVDALPKKTQTAPGDAVLAGGEDDLIGDQARKALADQTTELQTRLDELKADALLTPAERGRLQQKSMEALNLKLVKLEDDQTRAKQTADAAAAKASQMRASSKAPQTPTLTCKRKSQRNRPGRTNSPSWRRPKRTATPPPLPPSQSQLTAGSMSPSTRRQSATRGQESPPWWAV